MQRGSARQQDDPTLITGRASSTTPRRRSWASYQHGVLLRSGKDEIRSGGLTILERPDGKRHLEANARVISRMQPKAAVAGKVPATVESRAGNGLR